MEAVPGNPNGRARRALPLAGEAARPERRDAAEHRRQVLAAAARLFAGRGVAAVSMDEIAREAEVGKGTLYRRYAHKGELCQALLDENTRRLQAEVLERLRDTDAPAIDQLENLLASLAAHNDENAELLCAVHDAAFGDRRDIVYRSAAYEWRRMTALALLRRAVARGELPPLDADYYADALLAPLDITLYQFQRHVRGFSQARIVAGLVRLLRGLGQST
jgi:AcrR family transcriptional regulator